MLSESMRQRLERLNRQPLSDQRGIPESARSIAAQVPHRRATRALRFPPLLPTAETIENGSGQHLRMTVPVARIDNGQLNQQRARLLEISPEADESRHTELTALLDSFPQRTLFLDLETCGFAGSAIFLIGLLLERNGELVVELLFARNYAQERAILHSLWEATQSRDILVTYNGKSFDWPMVLDRTTYHRFPRGAGQGPKAPLHCDLLHHARRRWKEKLPDCRLQTIEYCLCGRRRVDDIAGARIPGAYHDFVRHGDPQEMESILSHNVQDLFTLLEIALRLF